jgi:hypothetical protein
MKKMIFALAVFFVLSEGCATAAQKDRQDTPQPQPQAMQRPARQETCDGIHIETQVRLTPADKKLLEKVYLDLGRANCLLSIDSCKKCTPLKIESPELK